MNAPKVTIITAAYNYGRFIEEALQSVLTQSFQDFEYIIIDDGSTDDTPERMKKYEGRVRYFYHANSGQYQTFNKAIAMAQGEYVAFLDADDTWHPDFLKRSVQFLDHSEAAMVFCNFSSFDERGIWRTSAFAQIPALRESVIVHEFIMERCLEHLIMQDFIFPSCSVIRRGVFDQMRFEPVFKGSDYDFFIRMALHYKIGVMTDVLTNKRDHDHNGSSNLTYNMTDRTGAMQRLLATPQLDPAIVQLAKKRLAEAYYFLAYDAFKKRNLSYSKICADQSLRAHASFRALKTWAYSHLLSPFAQRLQSS